MTSNAWSLKGTCVIACNCDFGCPCNFNALPSKGKCEGGWTWHVDTGSYEGVRLDGLTFGLYVNWPGAIHHGNGEGVFLMDERANAQQQQAIATLVGGQVGGPWKILAWTWPKLHGPTLVSYQVVLDGIHTRVTAGNALTIESTTIKNPVTGADVHPAVLLPEGIIVKRADLGCSASFRVSGPVAMDHSGQYTAVGPFEYTGP